jgi:hypothetical protein
VVSTGTSNEAARNRHAPPEFSPAGVRTADSGVGIIVPVVIVFGVLATLLLAIVLDLG